MKLKVAGFIPEEAEPELLFDPYVPVTITWPSYYNFDPSCSHMSGAHASYLEVKFSHSTGVLTEIVLLQEHADKKHAGPSPSRYTKKHKAVPFIEHDRSTSPPCRSRAEHTIRVDLYSDLLQIQICDRLPTQTVGAGVEFGVAEDGELVCINLHLSQENHSLLKRIL